MNGTCRACGCSTGAFRDQRSAREYRISGLCQACQDSFFTETALDLELHGGDTTISISVDMRKDGSATIEVFAHTANGDVQDIGLWTVDTKTRKVIDSLVTLTIDRWRTNNGMFLDDPSEEELVYADLKHFLVTGQKEGLTPV